MPETEIQQQLEKSAKLATIGELVSGVTHEINNALNFIVGTLPQLSRDMKSVEALFAANHDCEVAEQYPELLASIQKKIDRCIHGAGRVEKIIKNLRAFSGATNEDKLHVDLHQGLDATAALLAYEVDDRIVIQKEYGALPLIHCHPSQINQVFMNLLINASHAIPNKGTITIKTFSRDGSAVVEISDTGQGIPDEVLPSIFEPFFTTKKDGKGTGLGLGICRSIIEKHGGTISVASILNQGTTFAVTLPSEGTI